MIPRSPWEVLLLRGLIMAGIPGRENLAEASMLTFKSMTMTKRSYIFIVLCCAIFAGCKKQLDQQLISDLSSDLFWKTAEHAQLGNAAIYDGLQKTLSGNFTDWGDARSDNFTYGGTGENQINVVLNGLNATTPGTNWGNL